jgi:hypothetical protein
VGFFVVVVVPPDSNAKPQSISNLRNKEVETDGKLAELSQIPETPCVSSQQTQETVYQALS